MQWLWLLSLVVATALASATCTVTVKRISNQPIFNPNESVFDYNYNAAYLPKAKGGSNGNAGLLVRCQDRVNASNPYNVQPSRIAFASSLKDTPEQSIFGSISEHNVLLQPASNEDALGVEDPRVIYREKDGTYYLLYSCVHGEQGGIYARLCLATANSDPTNAEGWTRHGLVFPEIAWSKSGALLVRDDVFDEDHPHILIWGDSNLTLATSMNLRNFTNLIHGFLTPRQSPHFDTSLVEAGPMPLRLSNGHYLFLYNSARSGYPSPKPGYNLQYNVGFLILNGDDPTIIEQRSDTPILSPELPWEVEGLTPNVVFVEGWYPIPGEVDKFMIYYGAADTVIGAAVVSVDC
jgi:predicted GH43/DUF377 family glycosyl hydrolase